MRELNLYINAVKTTYEKLEKLGESTCSADMAKTKMQMSNLSKDLYKQCDDTDLALASGDKKKKDDDCPCIYKRDKKGDLIEVWKVIDGQIFLYPDVDLKSIDTSKCCVSTDCSGRQIEKRDGSC